MVPLVCPKYQGDEGLPANNGEKVYARCEVRDARKMEKNDEKQSCRRILCLENGEAIILREKIQRSS